jgi:cytochrome c553
MQRVLVMMAMLWPSVVFAGGNPADGKAKALACQACHVGSHAFAPRLAAQREAYLVGQLGAFKKGDRKSDLMSAIASQLGDADIANLAAYWSGLPAGDDHDSEAATAIQRSPMSFPREFPTGFTVYATQNDTDSKMVSKSYANAAATAAAKAGKPLPVGSVIMVVAYSTKHDASGKPVTDKTGAWVVDQPQSYSGMESRRGWGTPIPELLRNGDWAYNLFGADKTPRADLNQAKCLACHKPASANSYVFTLAAIRAKT